MISVQNLAPSAQPRSGNLQAATSGDLKVAATSVIVPIFILNKSESQSISGKFRSRNIKLEAKPLILLRIRGKLCSP